MFRFLLVSIAFIITLQASVYNVKYHGITLGEVDSLDTLKSNYLKAEVTNSIAKFMIGQKYFVFYSGNEPDINDSKFKKDTNMMVFAFQEALNSKPKYKVYKISDKKTMTLDCSDSKECKFSYVAKGKEKGRGSVIFDNNGEFIKIKEEISTVEISLK